MKETPIDWQVLKAQAKLASENAYAPYSKFHVGAAAVNVNNETFSGCNVENASYGLTMCAERNCIASAITQKSTQVKAILIYTHQEQLTPPCGACRQVISEFLSQDSLVASSNHLNEMKIWTVAELLPNAFTPDQLN
jgi:cytidine deaminase